jgi:hypothetical protein
MDLAEPETGMRPSPDSFMSPSGGMSLSLIVPPVCYAYSVSLNLCVDEFLGEYSQLVVFR